MYHYNTDFLRKFDESLFFLLDETVINCHQLKICLSRWIYQSAASERRDFPLYGSGYSKRNLEYYRQFYLCFKDLEITNTRVHNLTWSHMRRIMNDPDPQDREWYLSEASEQMWSKPKQGIKEFEELSQD